MIKNEFISNSIQETEEIAKQLATNMNKDDVFALYGELGSGKTLFVQKIAQALGVCDYVTSPSFVILNKYTGKFKIFHFDLYRLKNKNDLENIGFIDFLNRDGIVFIEWPEIAHNYLPEKHYKIYFEILNKNSRKITIKVNDE